MGRLIKIMVAISLLVMILGVLSCTGGSGEGAPVPGNPAPDFTLNTLGGQPVTLSGLKGRPVLLNFWASWCGPCRLEMPFLQQVYLDQEWQNRGLIILAVNLNEPAERVQEFVEFYGLTFPVLVDSQGETGILYNVAALPTTYFVDNDGIIRGVKRGAFAERSQIDRFILDALTQAGS